MKDRLVVQVPAGDGDYDTNDKAAIDSIVLNAFSPSGEPISSAAYYDPDADLDRNGIINGTDSTLGGTNWAAALARGVLSSSAVDNATGYDGYRYNPETMQYTVRHRWYDPVLGRWLQRDPLRYTDGMSLFEFIGSGPIVAQDPSGLVRTKFNGHTAAMISWIEPMNAAAKTAARGSIIREYMTHFGFPSLQSMAAITAGLEILALSANPTPPNNFANPTAFKTWNATREHRGWTVIMPTITCCDGKIEDATVNDPQHDSGWTPRRIDMPVFGVTTLGYGKADGSVTPRRSGIVDPDTQEPVSCTKFTVLSTGRLGALENLGQALGLTGQWAPYISREMEYEVCCNGNIKVDYRGSFFCESPRIHGNRSGQWHSCRSRYANPGKWSFGAVSVASSNS